MKTSYNDYMFCLSDVSPRQSTAETEDRIQSANERRLMMNKNDFAPVPPMGWNSYDYYNTEVNEEQARANAAYMAAHLKEFGWEYVVVDIEWYAPDAGKESNIYSIFLSESWSWMSIPA
jgi:alpha-galactosidase